MAPGGKLLCKLFGIEKMLQGEGMEPRPKENKKGIRYITPGIRERNGQKQFVASRHDNKTFLAQNRRIKEGLMNDGSPDDVYMHRRSRSRSSSYDGRSDHHGRPGGGDGRGRSTSMRTQNRPRDRRDEYRQARSMRSHHGSRSPNPMAGGLFENPQGRVYQQPGVPGAAMPPIPPRNGAFGMAMPAMPPDPVFSPHPSQRSTPFSSRPPSRASRAGAPNTTRSAGFFDGPILQGGHAQVPSQASPPTSAFGGGLPGQCLPRTSSRAGRSGFDMGPRSSGRGRRPQSRARFRDPLEDHFSSGGRRRG